MNCMERFPVIEVTEGEWTSGKFVEVLGLKFPLFFTNNNTESAQLLTDYISNFQTRPDDVFVATFPKSGTTWTEEIVWQIYNHGQIKTQLLREKVPYLDFAATIGESDPMIPDINTMPSPRIMKTHLDYGAVPKGANEDTKCKYIYVARNPKDVLVSGFSFKKNMSPLNEFHSSWEFYTKLFIEGNVAFGRWIDHVLSWWKHKDDPNVLFLKYEDLKKDLLSNVRKIANFLNKPLSEDVIRRIAEQCSFNGMKKNASSFSIPTKNDKAAPLLRKGQVGDWKNHFTPELNERFEKEVLSKLQGSGLQFDFEI